MDHLLNVCFEFWGFLKSVELTYYIHRSERDKKSWSRMAHLFSTKSRFTCAFEDSSRIKSLIGWFLFGYSNYSLFSIHSARLSVSLRKNLILWKEKIGVHFSFLYCLTVPHVFVFKYQQNFSKMFRAKTFFSFARPCEKTLWQTQKKSIVRGKTSETSSNWLKLNTLRSLIIILA